MGRIREPWTHQECQEILNLPTLAFAKISADGYFEKVNEETIHVLGWEPHELEGMKVTDFVHPDDASDALNSLSQLSLGKIKVITDLVLRCKNKDGSYKHLSLTASAKARVIYAIGTDISQKIQFEEELTIQTLVLESISEGVVITNQKGLIVYINSAEEALFGYGTDKLIGQSIYVLNGFNKEESQKYLLGVFRDVNEKGIWQGEWLNVKKDGTLFTTSCRVTAMWLNGERHLVIVQRDVTKRKNEQMEKEALQTRYKTFFEQSILPLQIFDKEGNVIAVNEAWCRLFDATRDDLEGYNILNDPGSQHFGILPYIQRAYQGESVEMPSFYIDPAQMGRKGRARWLEAWFSPVNDEKGELREVAVIIKDVTERVETEQKLKLSISERKIVEDRLSMAVKAGKVGIWEWKPGSDRVFWDETLESIYGYTSGCFSGKLEDYWKHLHPDEMEMMSNVVATAQSERKPYIVEHRIVRHDGDIRWVEGSGTTVFNEIGEPVLMMGTCTDITDKKIAALDQKILAEISEILSRSFDFIENVQSVADFAVDHFCDGVIVDQLKPDGNIERIVTSSKDQVVRARIHELQRKFPQRYSHDHPLFTALVSGKTIFYPDARVTWQMLREKYGEEYYLELARINARATITVRLKGRESLLGTMTFLTLGESRHRFEKRHIHLAEEIGYRTSMSLENSLLYLHSQEAIKSRDEFLSIASHELKTPLTSLTLQNQMRKRELDKGEGKQFEETRIRKMIDADDRQLRRINRLIDDMLDIARIRAHRFTIQKERFDLTSFMADVLERVAPQLDSAGCEFTVSFCGPVEVEGDIYRIEQVVVNILTNALKYGAGKPVRIEVQKLSHKVRLLVIDNGPGIQPGDTERIFQRFERAHMGREISGLGLGLYISRQIVQQHDGALYVLSNPPDGSTFVMELPLP